MRVKISVYDKTTDKDVTGEEKWYLGVDGKLYLVTNDVSGGTLREAQTAF